MSHAIFERNSIILLIGVLITVAIGGIVEIVPLFLIKNTIERVEGMRPYTPLELAGRQIYLREGCYTCHSQMIRSLRSEVDRYGHYSLAAESMYDHPFQWGSKRTGPDLARVGGKYSDEWHQVHMKNPRNVAPNSIMPGYAFLSEEVLETEEITDLIKAHRMTGVPYDDEMVENALADLKAQANPDSDYDDLLNRYGEKVSVRDFAGDGPKVTELDALIAYLQMLGTLVDTDVYGIEAKLQQ
ncbi:MAG: cytochrome-c oxidase, cbb3-type subunit II [Pseudomonadota bacterium]